MRLGSTPIHTFYVPEDFLSISKSVEITYSQNDNVILTKNINSDSFSENEITIKLTQEETFLFNPCLFVEIQLRLVMLDGSVVPSNIMKEKAEKCLSREVLS